MSAEWMLPEVAIRYIAKALLDGSPALAADELVRAVAEGRIAIANEKGEPQLVEPDGWLALQGLRDWWHDNDHFWYFHTVRFRRADIEAEFPLPGATKVEALTPEKKPKHTRKGVGGAPTQHDWDRIIREVFRRAYWDGPPKTIRPFAVKIIKWFEGEFGADSAPDLDTLRKRIAIWLADVKTGTN